MKPWQIMKAHEEGAKIEQFHEIVSENWEEVTEPTWDFSRYEYRIADPYRLLKEAHKRGEVIEWFSKEEMRWFVNPANWSLPPERYRIAEPKPVVDEEWLRERVSKLTPCQLEMMQTLLDYCIERGEQ